MGSTQQTIDAASRHYHAGQFAQAEILCRQALEREPNHPSALGLLGLIAHQSGRQQVSADFTGRAIAGNPNVPAFHSNLAAALYALGRFVDAMHAARAALRLRPDDPVARLNLGNAMLGMGALDDAIATYQLASRASPVLSQAHNNLGHALRLRGRLDEAVAVLDELVRARPDVADFRVNLANAMRDQGRIEEAISEYRSAVKAAPANAGIGSALLYALWFDPSASPRAIVDEHRAWAKTFADPLRDARSPRNDPNPDRRLRVGYVSAEFRSHVSGYLIEPILANHDHEQFEIFCYSGTLAPDELTRTLAASADQWRSTVDLRDEALAEQVRADRIDVLVDLMTHMSGNRLLALARKPAPVQVTYLAYPATSGLQAMDYRISTASLDPECVGESLSTERVTRLANTFWCYRPSPTGPQPNELPALTRGGSAGGVTFGSLNSYAKVNAQVVALWAEVLRAAPGSRLLVLIPGGAAGNRDAAAVFARHGIGAQRLRFVEPRGRDAYLALFHEVDLSLDPFPYNGHTTSLDSLWMSVPFVTLAGDSGVSRAGVCLLTNVGLPELIADTRQRYLELCVELAGDLPRLAEIRRGLRERMRNSPLVDAATFTRNLESAYRDMWRNWCAGAGSSNDAHAADQS